MNFLVSNRPRSLQILPAGRQGGQSMPLSADGQGRLVPSPAPAVPAAADRLDIRALTPARDSVYITGPDINVRPLGGAQDSLTAARASFAFAEESGLAILLPQTFLTRDISPYKENVFRVRNTGATLGALVQLQIAPVDIDAYYVNDGAEFELVAGGVVLLRPSRLMRYARVRVAAP